MRIPSILAAICCLVLPSISFGEIANSATGWSTDGTQGANGWSYGLYNATADADGTYNASDFQAFAAPDYPWNGTKWDEANADGDNVPWTEVGDGAGHPNGDNNGDIHYAMRRWESNHAGPVDISYSIAKNNANCGNGVTALLYHNDMEIGMTTIEFNDAVGLTTSVSATLAVGDTVDLALSPFGTDGTFNDGCDGSAFSMTIAEVPEPSSFSLLMIGVLALLRRRRA
jgi:hypothetical protein